LLRFAPQIGGKRIFLRVFFRSNSVEPSVRKPKARQPIHRGFLGFFNEKTMKTYKRNRLLGLFPKRELRSG
jgi:hypothetical protein